MSSLSIEKIIPPLIPYVTVGIGLLLFRNAWIAILSYHAGMIAVILTAENRISLKQTCRNNKARFLFIALFAGAIAGALFYLLRPYFSIPDDIGSYIMSIGLTEQTWPVFLVYFSIVNPPLEEYYWRGLLASDSTRITVNDVLFSGYHLIVLAGRIDIIWLAAVFLCLTAGAWFWRQINRLNGGLLASAVSHFTADILIILTIYSVAIN